MSDPVLDLQRKYNVYLREHLDQSRRENAILRVACRATLARLENPVLDTSLFDDVKQLLRIALEPNDLNHNVADIKKAMNAIAFGMAVEQDKQSEET